MITLAVRRFGSRVGGILGGLPVVAGPILFIYALEQGTAFAGDAAANSLAALVALATFLVVVAFAAPAHGAARSVLLGWVAFLGVAGLVVWIDPPPVVGLAAATGAFALSLRLVPHPDPFAIATAPGRPRFDLSLRAGVAAVMVLVLTSAAEHLGPAASGVLAPFPTLTSVLVGFAVAHETRATTLNLIRNMLRGFFSFAACLFTLAVTLEPWGIAPAFIAAIAATVAVQVTLLAISDRRPRAAVA